MCLGVFISTYYFTISSKLFIALFRLYIKLDLFCIIYIPLFFIFPYYTTFFFKNKPNNTTNFKCKFRTLFFLHFKFLLIFNLKNFHHFLGQIEKSRNFVFLDKSGCSGKNQAYGLWVMSETCPMCF